MEKNEKLLKLDKKSRIVWTITWIVLGVQTVGTMIAMKYLPDYLPMHFDSYGNVDRYGEKYELYVLLVLSFFMAMMGKAYAKPYREKLDKAENEKEKNAAATSLFAASILGCAMALLMTAVETNLAVSPLIHGTAVNDVQTVDVVVSIMNVGIGLILVILGNVMPKTGINGTFGVRTGWSRYNDETWSRTNRIGGRICVVTGILCTIIGLFVDYLWAELLIVGLIVIMAVLTVIVSYRVYRDVREKE